MNISDADRARVLAEALPYIQKYYGKTVVIKYGGNAMINDELKSAAARDVVLLSLVGIRVALVHGGGPEINSMLKRVNKESRFIDGLRYTDAETAEIVQMALCGKVNKDLVKLISSHHGAALGLCGIDGDMIRVKKLNAREDLGFVGEITSVDASPLIDVIERGYIPVVATVGSDGNDVYNVNADTAAARVAAELGAENLILTTDVRGLLRNKNDENTLIERVRLSDVPALKRDGVISGGMIPKVDCCVDAVRRGVKKAVIIDGRVEHAILIEILSDRGAGTMFTY